MSTRAHNEKNLVWQEIYDQEGKLVEIHEKYPVDKGPVLQFRRSEMESEGKEEQTRLQLFVKGEFARFCGRKTLTSKVIFASQQL